MKTFAIETLGCKVNQYESEQIAAVLREHGLVESSLAEADVRVVNSCSVTMAAAGKSRQTVRRLVSLPLLGPVKQPVTNDRAKVIVTGCWATSDRAQAAAMVGVDAVLTHHDDVADQLRNILLSWKSPLGMTALNEGLKAAVSAESTSSIAPANVNEKPAKLAGNSRLSLVKSGTTSLPLLGQRRSTHQRAFLKVQDGCDAHCTYCIIPTLRPRLWSKPIDDAVEEATRLVAAGHVELVLTGIFLGAYGQPTALRRRQPEADQPPVAQLIEALCTRVPGLLRLRLSSLEPGDLTPGLLAVLRSHPQVVPHFHLPLQCGSTHLLKRMNRQYTREDFLNMIDDVNQTFDRPAITTDIIVGFPGETDEEFAQTLDVVDHAKFIHIHAFSFSPRPGTAAARWQTDFIRGPVVNERIQLLQQRADEASLIYRQQFVGQIASLLVERPSASTETPTSRHGRSERYFDVYFEGDDSVSTGDAVDVRIDSVTARRTFGTLICQ